MKKIDTPVLVLDRAYMPLNIVTSKKAFAYCDKVKPYFDDIRYHCDKLELLVDDEIWPLTKYRELLFTR